MDASGIIDATRRTDNWTRYCFASRRKASDTLSMAVGTLETAFADRVLDLGKSGDVSGDIRRANKLACSLAREIYSRVYDEKNTPMLARPAPDTELLQKAHSALESDSGFKALCEQTHGDPDLAALGAAKMIDAIAEAIPDFTLEERKKAEQDRKREQGRRVRERAANPDGLMARAIQKASGKGRQFVAEVQASLEGLQPGLGFAPPKHEQQDDGRVRLAERLINNDKLKRAVKLAGRLKRLAAPIKAERDKLGRSLVTGVELGDQLSLALPAEIASLRPGSRLRKVALVRFAEKRMQQFSMEGRTPKGRGPIVILLDESGSMYGERHLWASAVCIACLKIASKENRACTIIAFNYGIRYAVKLDKKGAGYRYTSSRNKVSNKLPERIGKLADVAMRVASSRPDGGTSFDHPFIAALGLDESISDERADLILITDGHAQVSPTVVEQVNKAKVESGLRVFGLTVGGGSLGQAVNDLCDTAVDLDDAMPKDDASSVANVIP